MSEKVVNYMVGQVQLKIQREQANGASEERIADLHRLIQMYQNCLEV